jgi:hypothetical protein
MWVPIFAFQYAWCPVGEQMGPLTALYDATGTPKSNDMTRIYVSVRDKGDDNNDGLTRETAVYLWERAAKLCDGNSPVDVSEASMQRLNAEVERRRNK